jgi:ribosomal protein S27E
MHGPAQPAFWNPALQLAKMGSMPIQFRCAYCNQLLGIARRKAGTSVTCPTCGKPITVPTPAASPPGPGQARQPASPGAASEPRAPDNLLELDDFDQLFTVPEKPGQADSHSVPLAFADPGARVFTRPATGSGIGSQSPAVPGSSSAATGHGSAASSRFSTNLIFLVVGAALALLLLGFMAGLIAGRFVWLR